jgi:hypothetical protein
MGIIPGHSVDLYAQTTMGQQKLTPTSIDIFGSKEKLRKKVIQQTHEMYERPPKLHPRYTPMHHVKLQDRINRSTTHLIRWLARVWHQ